MEGEEKEEAPGSLSVSSFYPATHKERRALLLFQPIATHSLLPPFLAFQAFF